MRLPLLPARHAVVALLVALLAVLAPATGPAVAAAAPESPSAIGSEVVPVAAGPHAVQASRSGHGGPGDGAPLDGPPGPALDVLLPELPSPQVPTAVDDGPRHGGGTAGGPDPGHGVPADPRGPPAV
ncbi:hypothetical protein WIS52_18195 [Pseudonocardia nematodicida]|uniref:Secreted protein n=1 Tax=Pseudonocardia nematodicida TaxID=1206997 RepID=A0ABV1KEU5_9PSEU